MEKKITNCQSILTCTLYTYRTHAVKSPSSMVLICMNYVHTMLILLNSIGVHWNRWCFSLSRFSCKPFSHSWTSRFLISFICKHICVSVRMCVCVECSKCKCLLFFLFLVLIYSWLSKNSDCCYFFSGPTVILKDSGDQTRTFQPTNVNFNQSKLFLLNWCQTNI